MIIGITSRYIYENSKKKQFINQSYIDAFNKLGFTVIIILYQKDLDKVMSLCDCFLICGGGDVNPELYNQIDDLATNIENELDELDIKVIEYCINNNKPLFGICRGLQIINVYFDGTLSSTINKNHNCSNDHILEIICDNKIFKKGKYTINSYHHQGIKRLGKNLIPIGYSNKLIEVIIHLQYNIIAGQFHPELMNSEMGLNLISKWKEYIKGGSK